ncbi:MAG: efflux RND transporter periplasmic adaptor subunit [Candidatus Magasanikiibacteriota bacterium]
MLKILQKLLKHKFYLAIAIIVLVGGGYWGWQKFFTTADTVSYKTAKVEKGTLVNSISGTGQVAADNQVDIKSKTAGTVTVFNIKNSQEVKEGDLLAQIDSREAILNVNQAKTSLDLAELSLKELITPPSQTTIVQAENSLKKAKEDLASTKLDQQISYDQTLESKKKAEDNLNKAYEDAYNTITNTFLDLPDVFSGIYNILYDNSLSKSEPSLNSDDSNDYDLLNSFLSDNWSERDQFESMLNNTKDSHTTTKKSFDDNFTIYKNSNRYSEKDLIENLLSQTIETVRKTADVVKDESNLLDFWVDYRTTQELSVWSGVTSFQSDLNSYTSKVNSHLSSLLSAERTIQDDKDSILNVERSLQQMKLNNPLNIAQAERSINEQELKLEDLKKGATELDIEDQRLAVEQKKNDLLSAQQSLADRSVRAPFAGVIVSTAISRGDEISANTTVCSLITKQKIATITLNEIDIAKVKVGQKVNLTFDAVEDLTITGEVAEVDTLGTVSQGVVSYSVKIAFDIQDERIKPGMSVSASIIIDSKPDVLMVPMSAVKTQAGASYVEILVNNVPEKKNVQVEGSNDIMTEIVGGLNEGEDVITQTINTSATSAGTTANSPANSRVTGGLGGGEAFRALR